MSTPIKNTTTDPRPHLLPGIYSWLAENFSRVYVSVAANSANLICPAGLPTQKVIVLTNRDGVLAEKECEIITLNFGAEAINNFYLDDAGFGATLRFNSIALPVYIPFKSIYGISSPDGEARYFFTFYDDDEKVQDIQDERALENQKPRPEKRGHLTLVKG